MRRLGMCLLCQWICYTSLFKPGNACLSQIVVLGLCLGACLRVSLWYLDAQTIPACLPASNHDLQVVVNARKSAGDSQTLVLDVTVVDVGLNGCDALQNQRLRLSWYFNEFVPAVGSQLQISAKLRAPWGTKNPAGFDYGLWLIGQGYRGAGYIKSAQMVSAEVPAGPARLIIEAGRYVNTNLLNAILLGQRDAVSDEQWRLFRDTGTIHLMVISGLHVGVFAGVIFLMSFSLLRVLPWHQVIPTASVGVMPRFLALGCSVMAVGLLVYQTGATAPVVRAALMATAIAVTFIVLRQISWWRGFGLLALVALILQPAIFVQQGFWLSYAAVASLLVYFAPRQGALTWVRGLVICQGVLFVGLLPWLGITVGEFPLISPLANLIVVPLMTLVTIPVGITGAVISNIGVFEGLAHGCLLIADFSVSVVLVLLKLCRGAAPSVGYFSVSVGLCAWVAFLIMTLPIRMKHKLLTLLGWIPVLLPVTSDVPLGEFRVIALDVGQGSSAIVDTHRHRLVVDAGAAYPGGYSLGEAVVLPALRATGADRVDLLLVSHSDNDHAGGMAALVARYPGTQMLGLHRPCKDGERWVWDGVVFRTNLDSTGQTTNDRSCTLHISNGRESVYLSGDIGKSVERSMFARLPRNVDLLLAPHHGSANSSSVVFVNRLRAKIVVFSAGRDNRYRHPRPEIVERYQRRGAQVFITGLQGAVTWRSDAPTKVRSER